MDEILDALRNRQGDIFDPDHPVFGKLIPNVRDRAQRKAHFFMALYSKDGLKGLIRKAEEADRGTTRHDS